MIEYITTEELRDNLEIDGDFREKKLARIVNRVNAEISDLTNNNSTDMNILKDAAFDYAEYKYHRTPGTESESEDDLNYKWGKDVKEAADFVPDKYIVEEDERSDNAEISFL
ncbi:hypothetical protein [Fuchsiella alkaliacetigena]|uniref:hypothetical protein n=1 Tax=Fuchsiella alkaliacetigena TaxID=957042 RepID=UPI00200AD7BD|nr:hypothetical protein [Fuchsiella alkaliacetigena]MCK8824728.1 hypothetical protein [Fuchsiella alkaliacetigena]